jgi:DNA invertase Pin-like site-specific DNA recombinase
MPSEPTPIAFSYIRFSSPRQADGDSLRRQTENTISWCRRNGARLDESTTLHDLGRSAFTGAHRKNPDRHALAAFLKMVEDGRIPRGSFLVVEALDRLSREHIRPALTLLLNLIDAGVTVVQLKPVETTYGEDVEPMQLMMAIMELSRGHSESETKSQRCREAWTEKKDAARANGEVMTTNLPRWIESTAKGTLRLIPERAALVQRIFRMAAQGHGLVAIANQFNKAEKIPSFGGRRKEWTRSYLALILKDRRALGEHQPMRAGKPDGPVILNYYPAVVTEADWLAALAGRDERRTCPGRVARHVNLFANRLTDALSGGPYIRSDWKSGRKRVAYLINFRHVEGLEPLRAFPAAVFEEAILSKLREIDPHDILNGDGGPDEVAVLAGERAKAETELGEAVAWMEANGFSPTIGQRVTALEAKKAELSDRLASARAKAAAPAAEAWGELDTLADALAKASDPNDARLRLRGAIRRIVEGAWLLVVQRPKLKLAAVQIVFAGGRQRHYLMAFWPATGGGSTWTEPRWAVRSFSDAGPRAKDLDLRKPAHARKLAKVLADLDPNIWADA